MRVLQEKVPLQERYILIRAERWRKSLKEELRLLVLYDFYTVGIYFKELVGEGCYLMGRVSVLRDEKVLEIGM